MNQKKQIIHKRTKNALLEIKLKRSQDLLKKIKDLGKKAQKLKQDL